MNSSAKQISPLPLDTATPPVAVFSLSGRISKDGPENHHRTSASAAEYAVNGAS
jgi:hypothetical protein